MLRRNMKLVLKGKRKMTSEEYKKKLNDDVYAKFYGTDTPRCKYCDDCRKNLKDKHNKFSFYRAEVGNRYGKDPRIPKVMIVGLESKDPDKGNSFDDGEGNIVIKDIIREPSRDASNPHYRGVRYVLAYLLSSFCGKETPKSTSGASLYGYEFMTKEYVLTNVYKCAFGEQEKYSNLEHTYEMKVNCQELLFDEIEALEPDVVVIQGVSNQPKNFWDNISKRFFDSEKDPIEGDGKDNKTSAYKMQLPSGHPFIMIFTYHGAWRSFAGKKYLETLNKVLDAAIKELEKRFCSKHAE